MNRHQGYRLLWGLVAGLALALPVAAQSTGTTQQGAQRERRQTSSVAAGQKQKVKGVIISREADSFTLRDQIGSDIKVSLTNATKVEEKKSNPFRRAENFATTQLLRGLTVEVEGRGDSEGALVAEKIRFTNDALLLARTVETRVTPVEGRVGETENRLTQAEQNAQRLSGQLDELSALANVARGGAKAAQETADQALAGVNATNERISRLISGLDEYEASKSSAVNFRVNSAVLSPEAKATLDEVATQAKNEKGYVIEIGGFASADGSEAKNRVLSQRRADAVVRYLAENHAIPLRRIITPFGYGEAMPVADNTTRSGREQNRRVEVKILVNRGLNTPTGQSRPATSSSTEPQRQPTGRP